MNEESIITEKAERIRDVIRYIRKFKNALVIIYLDDKLLDSPLFQNHIKDICLIHEAGLKVIMVPGAAKRIDEVLNASNISWTVHNGVRITNSEAMPLIKMAAFDVSNQIMTALAREKKTAVIGNWVRARGKGIINGVDFGTSGEVDKLQIDAISTILENGFIPIFPCIGWSAAGKPYNISSIQLAEQIASHLQADKLFYIIPGANITSDNFTIPEGIGTSQEGTVPALNLEELDRFFAANEQSVNSSQTNECSVTNSENSDETIKQSVVLQSNSTERSVEFKANNVSREKILSLLHVAHNACQAGVSRVHILNGSVDGAVPCEIFSDLGSGTMIYSNNYGGIRDMTRDDISSVLNVMKPFVEQGILLPRTKESLEEQFPHYIVYELDGAIRACASLIPYSDGQMEIAGVAVDKTCSHIGIGPKMISFLVKRAKTIHAKSVFLLTTQTGDWFETQGFFADEINSIPEKRKQTWTPQRGSKVMRINL